MGDLIKAAGVGAVGGALIGSGAGLVAYGSGAAALAGALLLGGAGEGLLASSLLDSLDDGQINSGAETYARDAALGAALGLATAGLGRAAAPILKGPAKWLSGHVKMFADDVRGSVPLLPGGIKGKVPATEGATQAGARLVPAAGVGHDAVARIEISPDRLQHVLNRHTAGGTKSADASIFRTSSNLDELARGAMNTPYYTAGNGLRVRSYDTGTNVGWDASRGQDTSWVTVVTKARLADVEELWTMHPGRPRGA